MEEKWPLSEYDDLSHAIYFRSDCIYIPQQKHNSPMFSFPLQMQSFSASLTFVFELEMNVNQTNSKKKKLKYKSKCFVFKIRSRACGGTVVYCCQKRPLVEFFYVHMSLCACVRACVYACVWNKHMPVIPCIPQSVRSYVIYINFGKGFSHFCRFRESFQ